MVKKLICPTLRALADCANPLQLNTLAWELAFFLSSLAAQPQFCSKNLWLHHFAASQHPTCYGQPTRPPRGVPICQSVPFFSANRLGQVDPLIGRPYAVPITALHVPPNMRTP